MLRFHLAFLDNWRMFPFASCFADEVVWPETYFGRIPFEGFPCPYGCTAPLLDLQIDLWMKSSGYSGIVSELVSVAET